MGKVKAWLMEMDEDAQNMDEAEFVKKYGETYRYVWRNEQVWLESRKENREPEEFSEEHKLWEGGG
jgi:hypothetical protein|tara:strand:+ start:1170 stop:1367 length:198 start_codon:yes stop_codon:yes gene_type:complete